MFLVLGDRMKLPTALLLLALDLLGEKYIANNA